MTANSFRIKPRPVAQTEAAEVAELSSDLPPFN
jgi:hypothetical protein